MYVCVCVCMYTDDIVFGTRDGETHAECCSVCMCVYVYVLLLLYDTFLSLYSTVARRKGNKRRYTKVFEIKPFARDF